MVPITGNGVGAMDGMGSQMVGHGHNQPPATEYTLQGVMRFLQTEWHRHERDRNAWEIERQEMRGRIAHLEGQARRADATQKALRKYVHILERKVKEQTAQIKGEDAAHADAAAKNDRAAQIEAKLKSTAETHVIPGVEDVELDRPDDEGQRQDLKNFLDQCQNEFMYLMITPANPQPPRESPQLPIIEDLREVDFGSVPGGQPMERQYPAHQRPQNYMKDVERQQTQQQLQQQQAVNHGTNAASKQNPNAFASRNDAQAQPMTRSGNDNQPAPVYNVESSTQNDWNGPVSVTTRAVDEHADTGSATQAPEDKDKRNIKHSADIEGWEFPEGTFPEPGSTQIPSTRPDTDVFPNAENPPKSPNKAPGQHRRKSSMSRRLSAGHESNMSQKAETGNFKLRYGLRGHLNAVRTVIFSGGGSPGEPEICTAGDDSMIKRFHIPRLDGHGSWNSASDLDVTANFTHRGHSGAVLCLASWSPAPNFTAGGRAQGDGWIFSGGQDATIRVWERGRVDPKATLEGHTDAVWALCVLPATLGSVFGASSPHGSADRMLLVSGAADGSVRLWSVTGPPQLGSPQPGANRGVSGRGGRVRGNSMSSGSGFSSTPQPTMASNSPFNHTLIHNIVRPDGSTASPTAISPLGNSAESFIVSYSDAAVMVYDTRTGEQLGYMDSMETYDGSKRTGVNTIVATTVGLDQAHSGMSDDDNNAGGPTGGGRSGVEGTIITGHEDRFVRFFDANSGQCTYNMLAHPDAISSLSLSPDGLELVSGGHDASLRFWNLEKRTCIQEMTAHRLMRGEGVCSVVWSQDGKWVVSGGGDGVIKVFAR
ncbi:Striatin-like protein [Emericellopsis cladophorae]|uniref:Striatin-like protein n=1 Tax=Emericellopsis cladophorae TaxID=2686198 RepID=A0A9P9Y1T9_9HYPO|nr:Striatin-like protein [Emericellopsis cladophorae]KAI6781578.1 Striatin-like protein [Emericellopsis cladophorae]